MGDFKVAIVKDKSIGCRWDVDKDLTVSKAKKKNCVIVELLGH